MGAAGSCFPAITRLMVKKIAGRDEGGIQASDYMYYNIPKIKCNSFTVFYEKFTGIFLVCLW